MPDPLTKSEQAAPAPLAGVHIVFLAMPARCPECWATRPNIACELCRPEHLPLAPHDFDLDAPPLGVAAAVTGSAGGASTLTTEEAPNVS